MNNLYFNKNQKKKEKQQKIFLIFLILLLLLINDFSTFFQKFNKEIVKVNLSNKPSQNDNLIINSNINFSDEFFQIKEVQKQRI